MEKKERKDCRAIGDDLLSKLKNGGGFEEFVKFVREHKELILCFRGNSNPDQVVIYYNNHQMWKLYICGNKLTVSISFNHARYSEDWEKTYKTLCKNYNFTGKIKEKDNIINIGEMTAKISLDSKFNKEFVEGTYKIMKSIIDDFFNMNLQFDYFKKQLPKKSKSDLLEKKKQQELYIRYDNLNNGIFVYDLEFAQPRVKDDQKDNNQPDMLGIEFKNKKPIKLLLIEVKCTDGAMKGSSGFKKHISGMEEYLNTEENYEVINNRIKEASEILKQYKELELKQVTQEYNFDTLPIEIRIILTDEAVDYFYRNKKYWANRKDEESNSLFKILETKGYEILKDEKLNEVIITKII